jgi:hypothetical protein
MRAVLNNPTIPTMARMMFDSDQIMVETADLHECDMYVKSQKNVAIYYNNDKL